MNITHISTHVFGDCVGGKGLLKSMDRTSVKPIRGNSHGDEGDRVW
jgi:hypothetical protein